jgi:hypothetical protein
MRTAKAGFPLTAALSHAIKNGERSTAPTSLIGVAFYKTSANVWISRWKTNGVSDSVWSIAEEQIKQSTI